MTASERWEQDGPNGTSNYPNAHPAREAGCFTKVVNFLLCKSTKLSSFDLEGVAAYIRSGKARNIVVMCGAGISVSAGIPDFRSPGTGLYSQLQRYNLPTPESVFSIDFFARNPKPFHLLAKELFPGNFAPTLTHCFIELLDERGLLTRCYTQNIDGLEQLAGLPGFKTIWAHGNFSHAFCVSCHTTYEIDYFKQAAMADDICRCSSGSCRGLVKPSIVFFGEGLPYEFFQSQDEDFGACDLLLVMGTSLAVAPFNELPDLAGRNTPRVLINREAVGDFKFAQPGNHRDVFCGGNCDDIVLQLVGLLGPEWEEHLYRIMQRVGCPMP